MENKMRPILASAALVAAALLAPATAQAGDFYWGNSWSGPWNYPWCAEITSNRTSAECAYETQAQCLATVWGVGGFCKLNPWYVEAPAYETRHKARRHPRS
jgi:hypothetical protein